VTDLADALIDALDETAHARLAERLAPHLGQLLNSDAGDARGRAAYSVATLADELGVSRKTIRGAIRRGDLRAVKRAGRFLISRAAVEAWATPPDGSRAPARRAERQGSQRVAGSLRAVLSDLE
jgi:excisionase family DNA binding protein